MKRNFFLLLLINTIFYFAISILLPLRFEQNDDVLMLLFASGKYTGTPEPNLVFINYLLGYFLKSLYLITNKLEWYTIFFYVIHIFSTSVIVWKVIKSDKQFLPKWLFVAVIYLIELTIIFNLNFTTTAAISAMAGCIVMLNDNKFVALIGVVFFIIGALLRFDAAMLVFLIFSPILLRYFHLGQNKLKIEKQIYVFSMAIVIVTALNYINTEINYSNKDWKNYYEFNVLRGKINDNPNANRIYEKLPKNIHQSDYKLLLEFFPNSSAINLETINQIKSIVSTPSLEEKLKNILPSLNNYKYPLMIIFLLFVSSFLSTTISNRYILFCLLLTFLAILFYIPLTATLKNRVFISAIIPFLYIVFICFNTKITNKYYYTGLIAMFVFVIITGNWAKRTLYSNYYWIKKLDTEQSSLLDKFSNNSSNKVIGFRDDLRIEFQNPFKISKKAKERYVFFFGWATMIPYNRNSIESFKDLIGKNSIFMKKENCKIFLPLITESIKNNYGISVIKKIELESENYVIVTLVK
jgi:hypothetical protein